MSALPKTNPTQNMTIEEYIEFDKLSEERFEYFAGELFAMAGGSPEHSRICVAVSTALSNKLDGGPCEVFNSDMRLKVPLAQPYRYPDAVVVCGEAQFEMIQGVKTLLNPVLIVEVLSVSSANYDYGPKFIAYQSIESFREYLVIAQDRPHVIQHIKQPIGWLRLDTIGLDSTVKLASIQAELSLREIYKRVQFPTE
jgi:Uma2 family endonuclease